MARAFVSERLDSWLTFIKRLSLSLILICAFKQCFIQKVSVDDRHNNNLAARVNETVRVRLHRDRVVVVAISSWKMR